MTGVSILASFDIKNSILSRRFAMASARNPNVKENPDIDIANIKIVCKGGYPRSKPSLAMKIKSANNTEIIRLTSPMLPKYSIGLRNTLSESHTAMRSVMPTKTRPKPPYFGLPKRLGLSFTGISATLYPLSAARTTINRCQSLRRKSSAMTSRRSILSEFMSLTLIPNRRRVRPLKILLTNGF